MSRQYNKLYSLLHKCDYKSRRQNETRSDYFGVISRSNMFGFLEIKQYIVMC